jgi:NAD(P)-dependent dehydrogenase (short-subunit alcohol dehydrogenase family)
MAGVSPNVMDLFSLKGRVFLVVGGARDLGRDMAGALAEAGGDGMITSRTAESGQKTAAELSNATGRRIVGVALDANNEDSIKAAVHETVKTFGKIDVVVNNLGGGAPRPGAAVELENRERGDWDRLMEANVTGPFLVMKHVAPVLKRQKSGSVINIASIAGLIGRDREVYQGGIKPQTLDYAAAKAAVLGFTRDLAAYLGRDGIRVNAISPGGFERGQPTEFIKAYSRKAILGRMGRDGVDLKGAVVYLASDAAAYVTGHNLVVDGGFTVWQ